MNDHPQRHHVPRNDFTNNVSHRGGWRVIVCVDTTLVHGFREAIENGRSKT